MARFCRAFSSAFFLFVSLPVAAIEVGPEVTLPNSALAPVTGLYRPTSHDTDGAIAASRCGENYLVAWGGSDGAIYAARVAFSGDVLDPVPLRIADNGNSPAVASNGDSCLVVWAYVAPPAPNTLETAILGLRLTTSAEPIDAQPIVIEEHFRNPQTLPIEVYDPQVTSDGLDYLVTYYRVEYAAARLAARTVTHDARVLDPVYYYAAPQWDWRIMWSAAYGGSRLFVAHSCPVPCACATTSMPPGTIAYATPDRFVALSCESFLPIAVASDGDAFLVLFTKDLHPSGWPQSLRAAWVSEPHDFSEADTLALEPTLVPTTALTPVVAAYDGEQYVAIWFTPPDAPQAFGAVLPRSFVATAPTKEALFSGAATVPALATFGNGTSLLAYAAPSSSDPAIKEVRARLILTDETPPVVTVPPAIAATATSTSGAVVSFTATGQDDYSDAVQPTCHPASGATFPPGTTRVSCTATDAAGNTGVGSFDVAVTFAWSGVLRPLNADGSSVFKAGRAVPVKFQLTGASSGISDLLARLTVYEVSDAVLGSVEGPAVSVASATTGNLFRYDVTSGQYIFKAALAAGTWKARIDMGDGVERTVLFSMRE